MNNVPIPDIPVMIDRVLAEWQAQLKDKLTWLDAACGKVVEMKLQNKPVPAIYIGGGDYKQVLPDDTIGNYSFFDIAPKYKFASWNKNIHSLIKVEYGLVFWFNQKKILTDSEALVIENIKADILQVLSEDITLRHGSYDISSIAEGARGVFANYSQTGYDQKYLMYPYSALRFNGSLIFNSR